MICHVKEILVMSTSWYVTYVRLSLRYKRFTVIFENRLGQILFRMQKKKLRFDTTNHLFQPFYYIYDYIYIMILKHENTCVEKYVKRNFCWVELPFISFFVRIFAQKYSFVEKYCVYIFFCFLKGSWKTRLYSSN